MRASLLARVVSAAAVAALAAACGGTTAPTAPPTSQPVTTSQPQLRELSLLGAPLNVHIGSSADVRAVAVYSDGGYVDVTNQATWSSSHAACRVTAGGTVTGISAGTAEVSAEYAGVRSAIVRVACGFVITIVTHESFPTEHVTLSGVSGEVMSGPLAGYRFTTDGGGRAQLPPVAAPGFSIHVSKTGFENQVQEVRELPRDTSLSIPMAPEFEVRREFGGECAVWGYSSHRGYFTMPRDGRLRVTVLLTDFASLPGNPRIWGEVKRRTTMSWTSFLTVAFYPPPIPSGSPPSSQIVFGTAADYFVDFEKYECRAPARWRGIVEYGR